jgi:hypothetical protein
MRDILFDQTLPKRGKGLYGMYRYYLGLVLTGESQRISENVWSGWTKAGGIENGLNFGQHSFSPEKEMLPE